MDYTSTAGAIACAAAWAISSRPLTPTLPTKNTEDPDSISTCPVSGHRVDEMSGRQTKCPFSSTPLLSTCDPSIGTGELDIPDVPPLTEAQKDIIKSTAPVLGVHGVTITTHFYDAMLAAHPDLKNVFSNSAQKLGHQPRALAAAVHAYATNIHDLSPILPVVERIAHKHASLHIVAQQYGIVGKHLIEAIVAVLGEAVTPQIADAWYNGYWNLAKVFIQRERGIYERAVSVGGWEGFKPFKIARRVEESTEITSFYLEPVDGGAVPAYLPGQYIAVAISIPSLGHRQARQYSLSDASKERYYRISVKREGGEDQPGCVSNNLHDSYFQNDEIMVSSPFGDFQLDATILNPSTPIVLISAGVGQTPLIAMLNSEVSSSRPISYITVARSRNVHAFHQHLLDVVAKRPNTRYRYFHSSNLSNRLRMSDVKEDLFLGDISAQYFICGPAGFMQEKQKELEGMGVGGERVHVELFGAGNLE